MRSRLLAVFVVGVLAGALLLGGGVFALQTFGGDAGAQSGATWQTKGWSPEIGLGMYNMDRYSPDPEAFVDDWIRTLPAECDLVALDDYQLAYRCPVS